MATPLPLMPLSEGAPEMNRTPAAVRIWMKNYPDLGLMLAGRVYLWRAVVAAIATGSTLDDAAKIGAREKAAYMASQRERFARWFTAPADEHAAAAA